MVDFGGWKHREKLRKTNYDRTIYLPTSLSLQAITSGSIPGFVDVVLNFGSTALTDDNLITQLKLAGKILTFFGDDTWLNLFPDHFTRTDGTTSFFVTDFTEVIMGIFTDQLESFVLKNWHFIFFLRDLEGWGGG